MEMETIPNDARYVLLLDCFYHVQDLDPSCCTIRYVLVTTSTCLLRMSHTYK